MEYIREEDYRYITNKYHNTALPFDPHKRFIRNDGIFNEESGVSPEEILMRIGEQDRQIADLPHPIRKARAFALVLKQTRISCDRRDRFPAINMIDRPLNQTLVAAWKKEVFHEMIPEVEAKRKQMEADGVVTIWPDYDHSVPSWDRIFALGFRGLLNESEHIRNSRPRSAKEDAFFEGIRITYEALLSFIDRLYALAKKTEGAERMASALQHIQVAPPSTFYEALLVDYLYFMISEHIEGLQVRSLSHFDRLFEPFYRSDLKNGIPEEEIRTDLAYFFLQFTAIGNYWNQPVFLGGCKENGDSEINALSYLFLDVYDRMGIYNPKVQIKLADSTPKDFSLKALDMIRRGRNSIVFVSDATIRKALVRSGATEDEARRCNITGCYEYSLQGSYGTGMNYLNLLKPLEYALHEGRDAVTKKSVSIQSPPPNAYVSFDQLYAEYKRQLLHIINETISVVNAFEDYLAYINPQSLLSATFPSALEHAKDALCGGAYKNNTSLMVGFLADFADSMAMIQKYVFERKELSLSRLVEILDSNYREDPLLQKKLLLDREKYGNNKDRPDRFATDIVRFITKHVQGRPNASMRRGTWDCGFHVARQSYTQGDKTAASPNGRLLGEELSKNCSASMGQNREGATAAILSVTKIDATAFIGDAALDLGLLPSAVKGEDGLEALYGMLMTFIKRGGHAMHINVFDAETLRDAQAHPERYRDLQIRVCGWNVLWNNINKTEQDGFIRQAESLV